MKENPFALPSGEPIPGKFGEWLRWRDENWKEYLASLSDDEREAIILRKRAISLRMALEAGVLSAEQEMMAFLEYSELIKMQFTVSGDQGLADE